MVEGIINGVPLWVWPLFLVLLFFGLKATKQRRSPVWVMYLLPLLGIFSLNAASKFPGITLVWMVFGIGYIAGALVGYAIQKKWLLAKEGNWVDLAGEWMTLVTMMTVFLANFVAGMLKAVSPDLYGSDGFAIIFVGAIAAASGMFFGRGLRVLRS